MPAAKSMESQETRPNSGSSSGVAELDVPDAAEGQEEAEKDEDGDGEQKGPVK